MFHPQFKTLCHLCGDWIPIPATDGEGICPYLTFPNNKTMEHDICTINRIRNENDVFLVLVEHAKFAESSAF